VTERQNTTDQPRPVEQIVLNGRIRKRVATRDKPDVVTRRLDDGRWETLIIEPEPHSPN
jgi:hypothetical protein